MSTDVDERVDLDVDLDKDVPCLEADEGCAAPATQRGVIRHGETVCMVMLLCDRHAAETRRWVAIPGINVCRRHGLEVVVVWSSL